MLQVKARTGHLLLPWLQTRLETKERAQAGAVDM
jgi:hypothetical protein